MYQRDGIDKSYFSVHITIKSELNNILSVEFINNVIYNTILRQSQ